MQTRRVFLSYRREDSAAATGRLSDTLVAKLGDGNVFMDVDGIPLGVDFIERLRDEVSSCAALLAIIGPRWLEIVDEAGGRRLDDPNDFVRVEIAAALQRNIPVIPILLDGTKIPRADRLPVDLKLLPRRNGLDVRQSSFHSDVARLITELKTVASVAAVHPSNINSKRRDQDTVTSSTPEQVQPMEVASTSLSSSASRVADDESQKPVNSNVVQRCIYGTLLGLTPNSETFI